jgi:hypothetical protein
MEAKGLLFSLGGIHVEGGIRNATASSIDYSKSTRGCDYDLTGNILTYSGSSDS